MNILIKFIFSLILLCVSLCIGGEKLSSEDIETYMTRQDIASIADSLKSIQIQNYSSQLRQIDAINQISSSIDALNFTNQLNSMMSLALQSQQLKLQRDALISQEEWNRWNGLVSLLNSEQKQVVLSFNQTGDQDLLAVWLSVRNSTKTFPTNWLMPTKYRALARNINLYWTEFCDAQEYINFIKELSPDNRVNLWSKTGSSVKNRFKMWTKDLSNQEYFKNMEGLDLRIKQELWGHTNKETKKSIQKFLKARKKAYTIEDINEYAHLINYVNGFWLSDSVQREWKYYSKARERYLVKQQAVKGGN